MKFIKPLIVAFLQVAFFIGIYLAVLLFFKAIGYKYTRDLSWGISVELGFFLFVCMVTIINYSRFILNNKAQNYLMIFCIIIFVSFYLRQLSSIPYKVSMLIFCALIGFLSKYAIDKIIYKNIKQ